MPRSSIAVWWSSESAGENEMSPAWSTPSGTVTITRSALNVSSVCVMTVTPSGS
nr:hypothetical protein [Candidatus Microthrix sp.]